jgi:hypothetical protein
LLNEALARGVAARLPPERHEGTCLHFGGRRDDNVVAFDNLGVETIAADARRIETRISTELS